MFYMLYNYKKIGQAEAPAPTKNKRSGINPDPTKDNYYKYIGIALMGERFLTPTVR